MIAKTERDYIAADLAAVEGLLEQLTPTDILGRSSLESRRKKLRDDLEAAETRNNSLAASALFFSGQPVLGSRGIDSDFAAASISKYQEVVSKVFAITQTDKLGTRGVVPGKANSKLHITRVVHGSFGFQFEELKDQTAAFDTGLKETVDKTSTLLRAFGETSDDVFEEAVEDIDGRVLMTVRDFFEFMHDNGATFRLVSGSLDQKFDVPSIHRAIDRAKFTTIEEAERVFHGTLKGLMPYRRQFEYLTETERGLIVGRISKEIPDEVVSQMLQDWYNKPSVATIHIKSVLRQGNIHRQSYTLQAIKAGSDRRQEG